MNVLQIRDKNGNFVGIPAISGADGKSAYESAVDGGFIGTEEEFNQAIAELRPNTEHTENKDNPHEVTAKQVGALPTTGGVVNGNVQIDGWLVVGGDMENGTVIQFTEDGTFAVHNTVDGMTTRLKLANGNKVAKGGLLKLRLHDGSEYALYGEHNKPSADEIGAVAKSGGTMTGPIVVNKHSPWGQVVVLAPEGNYRSVEADAAMMRLDVRDTTSADDRRYVDILSNSGESRLTHAMRLVQVNDGVASFYPILHTGNKPSGSYPGSGSTPQTIQIGGIGNILLITSDKNDIAFVHANGARVWVSGSTSATTLSKTKANFTDGVLTLTNASSGTNVSGVTYYYTVL